MKKYIASISCNVGRLLFYISSEGDGFVTVKTKIYTENDSHCIRKTAVAVNESMDTASNKLKFSFSLFQFVSEEGTNRKVSYHRV